MSKPQSVSIPLYVWLAALGFCALWATFGAMIVESSREHDFLNLYTGGAFVRDGDAASMHLPEAQLARERSLVPALPELVPFVRMPFYGGLLAPLSMLPFVPAFWIWIAVQVGVLAAMWWLAVREWGAEALILATLYLPTALGIAHGQDNVLIAAIVAGVYVLARRDRDLPAGLVLGLGLIKFHLFLLWPLALLLTRKWRMIGGASITVAAALLVSMAMGGVQGLERYFALITMDDLNRLNPSPELVVSVHGLALNLGGGPVLTGMLVVLAAGLTAASMWRAPFTRWFPAVCLGSLLVAPHVYGYDASLLLIPLLLLAHEGATKWTRAAAVALIAPLCYFAAMAGSPWAAATPVLLLAVLVGLAYEAASPVTAGVLSNSWPSERAT